MENRIDTDKHHNALNCSVVQSRMQQMLALEQQGRADGLLLISGVVSCPFGARCATAFTTVGPVDITRCRAEIELPRFTDDQLNQQARDIWPNEPHRSLAL